MSADAHKSASDLFREHRTAEIMHFIEEMEKEYLATGKCTSEQWRAILRKVHQKVGWKALGEHLPKDATDA